MSIADITNTHSAKTRPKRARQVAQVTLLMDKIIETVQDKPTTNKDLADFSRAFSALAETKRKLLMKPLPKAVDVEKPRRKRVSSAGGVDGSPFIESEKPAEVKPPGESGQVS